MLKPTHFLLGIIGYVLMYSQSKSFKSYYEINKNLQTICEQIQKSYTQKNKIFALDVYLTDNLEFKLNRKANLILGRNELFKRPRPVIEDKSFKKEFEQNAKILVTKLKSNKIPEDKIIEMYEGLYVKKASSKYTFLIGATLFSALDYWPDFSLGRKYNPIEISNLRCKFQKVMRAASTQTTELADLIILTKDDIDWLGWKDTDTGSSAHPGLLFFSR